MLNDIATIVGIVLLVLYTAATVGVGALFIFWVLGHWLFDWPYRENPRHRGW